MSERLVHEKAYRGDALLERMRTTPIMVLGAGALGANLVENLVRQGCEAVIVLDRDKVEWRNLATQPYSRQDIGALKARTVAFGLQRELRVAVGFLTAEMTSQNVVKLIRPDHIIVDAFDNYAARAVITEFAETSGLACLHAGIAPGGEYAEVIWNERYKVPGDAAEDVCDYPLSRNIALMTATLASEILVRYIRDGKKLNKTFTFGDFAIRDF